ncbi:response regulator receiver protein [Stanieria cyanosphaera PCC 7437]|uniref:Response regulator receiver protein n=1 Tax=Stanieria cyanosphaera (strain ATCC 29371 / PCC 7437) TaxID=111780 RepID=K9XZ63_STAC7|nr:response regulator [Stanieria cyanosphaera]AFZ37890.1 response regulator receiver protein [Stanieria cyanosphaera PCC 7437]
MTTAKDGISHTRIQIQQFTLAKQTELFESLKRAKFSGQLLISDSQSTTWIVYFYLGRIMYAAGGKHSVRRWRRHLFAYCPEKLNHLSEIQAELNSLSLEESRISWEYQLLSLWIAQNKVTREQADNVIKATVLEILFDINQALQISAEIIKDNLLSTRLTLIDAEELMSEAYRLWEAWQNAKLSDRSPDLAPIIRQPEALKQKTSAQVYQNLIQLLDGQQTLRDLSVRMKRDLVTVTRSLLPYVQSELVQLVSVDDIPPPVSIPPLAHKISNLVTPRRTLVACIDDSPSICQTMEKVITEAGYQFLSETNGLRAIAVLLNRKPDVIFLDLIMPNTNGYEICTQLRKLSCFKTTPIIILTGNDGLIDRVRAKMVGSTDFLNKPVDKDLVLGVIDKYLNQKV